MKKLLIFVFMAAALHAAGTVTVTCASLGYSITTVTYAWTADASAATVPASGAACLTALGTTQGLRVFQVTTIPGSPAPTGNYSVTLKNDDGADILAASAAALSASTTQFWPVNAPPLNGTLTLAVTGNAVNSAKGTVVVFLSPQATARLIPATSGPSGPAGGKLSGTYPNPGLNAASTDLSDSANIDLLNGTQTLTGFKTFSGASLGISYLSTTKTAGSGGVTAAKLCKIDSTGNVVLPTVSDVGILGVCVTTQSAAASVEVATRGIVTCVADNTTVIGDVVIVGSSNAGDCRDSGQTNTTQVSSSVQVIGKALSVATVGNTFSVQLYGPGHYGALINLANPTGTLGLVNGGTNSTDAAVNGGLVWSNASGYKISALLTANAVLLGGGAGVAPFTDATALTVNQSTHAVTFGNTVLLADGTASLPAYSFSNRTDAGMYHPSGYNFRFAAAGTDRFGFDLSGNNFWIMTNNGVITMGASADITICRDAAGTVGFGTTSCNDLGSWKATSGTLSSYSRVVSVAVTSLPACAAGTKGGQATVNDSLAPAWGVQVANGGAAYAQVTCNGTNWTVTGI